MAFNATAATERIKRFNIHSLTYKTVHAVPLTVDIIIPKPLPPGKYRVIVRFHGGFLVRPSSICSIASHHTDGDSADDRLKSLSRDVRSVGARLRREEKSYYIRPNYRKLQEAKEKDLLNDLDGFWAWVKRDLARDVGIATGGKLEVDSERALVAGQSAGKSSSSYNSPLTHHTFWMPEVAYKPRIDRGDLAAQSALRPLSAPLIRATVLAYPMLDMHSPWFTLSFEKHPFNRPVLPASVLASHISTMPPNAVIGAVDPPARMDLGIAAVQQGRFEDLLGSEEECYPFDMLERVRAYPSACFIYHGLGDTAVSVDGTRKWVELLARVVPGVDVVMKLEPGIMGIRLLRRRLV